VLSPHFIKLKINTKLQHHNTIKVKINIINFFLASICWYTRNIYFD